MPQEWIAPHTLHQLHQWLVSLKKAPFPPFLSINRLKGDASERHYYRVSLPNGSAFVFTIFPRNAVVRLYEQLAVYAWLRRISWPIPTIYHWSPEPPRLLQEDAGNVLLQSLVITRPASEWVPFYEQLIDRWHQLQDAIAHPPPPHLVQNRRLDAHRFLFELDFLHTHFIRGFLGQRLSGTDESRLYQAYEQLARDLEKIPLRMCHRDYHSRNVLIKDASLFIIDYQDFQLGPAPYDLVSLLRDAYTRLDAPVFEHLRSKIDDPDVRHETMWHRTALQRHLKALGTFGFQITQKANRRFQPAIARTLDSILNGEELASFPPLKPLRSLLLDALG